MVGQNGIYFIINRQFSLKIFYFNEKIIFNFHIFSFILKFRFYLNIFMAYSETPKFNAYQIKVERTNFEFLSYFDFFFD